MTLAVADAPWFAEIVAASPETLGLAMLRADPHGWRLDRAAQFAAVSDALADGAGDSPGFTERFPHPDAARNCPRASGTDRDHRTMIRWLARSGGSPNTGRGPPHIVLYNRGIAPLERTHAGSVIERLLGWATPRAVFVAHELYHHAETLRSEVPIARRYQPTLFELATGDGAPVLRRWPMIAAGAFAQSLLDLPCHPCVLNFVARDTIVPSTPVLGSPPE